MTVTLGTPGYPGGSGRGVRAGPGSGPYRRSVPVRPVARLLAAVLLLVGGCAGAQPPAEPVTADPAPADPAPADPALVATVAGAVRGTVTAGHRFFGGIPYAAAPTGELRFAPPRPAPTWTGVRDATRPGPRCLQGPGAGPDPGAEDCLVLNVWTPPPGAAPRPVLVWIHGGAFVAGSGDIYDAHRLAERGGLVVVTVNYRLGAAGFLAHPALGPDAGTAGLADQQAALRWVRDNIAAFGGDPERVTIAGESAGAMSVCDHLVAPGSRGLFHAAIVMSGPCRAQADATRARRVALAWAADAGCADPATAAACLRALPAERLRTPLWQLRLAGVGLSGPVVGTPALPDDPMTALTGPGAAAVPLLIGTTRDEFRLFAGLRYLDEGERFGPERYRPLLAEAFGADADLDAVAARYPVDAAGGVAQAWSAAVTDAAFACPAGRIADGRARLAPVYAYEFADPAPPTPEPLRRLPFPVAAAHSLELRSLFDVGGAPPPTPAQRRLAEQMVDAWSRFAATGDPGWPRYTPERRSWMQLRPDGSRPVTDFDTVHQCAFWDDFPDDFWDR